LGWIVKGQLLQFRRPTGETEISDAALLAACAVDDSSALGVLFDRHSKAVYRFAARLAGADADDLDDVVQATFVEAYRCAGSYQGTAPVRAWLLGIAANVVRHHVRSEVRRKRTLASLGDAPANDPTRPDDQAAHRELVARAEQAMACLPHPLRVVFVMCVIEEIPGVEVAKVLGLRQGTLWRRLYDARAKLRAAMEGLR
jgi:RNA polymerase sigma-70 factor (ECF subfamily)